METKEYDEKVKIMNQVKTWVHYNLYGFEFRPYQLEYIIAVIYSIVVENKNVNIIEAPTGSGKSIMVLIMAGVLNFYYQKKSFILVSDLYLWQQYSDAIDKYGLMKFGKLKGTWNNYICSTTGVDLSIAPCRLAMVSFKQLCNKNWASNNDWECANTCEYMIERSRAVNSEITLMTYQLYFPYLDDMTIHDTCERVFPPRDIVFCDECHNIPDLCQTYSTIVMDKNEDLKKYQEFIDFISTNKEIKGWYTQKQLDDCKSFYNDLSDLYERSLLLDNEDKDGLYNMMNDMWNIIHPFFAEYIETVFYDAYKAIFNKQKRILTKKECKAIDNAKWIDKFEGSLHEHIKFIEDDRIPLVISDNKVEEEGTYKKVWPDNPCVSFKYAREDVLVYDDILKNQPFNVLLSATIGDHDTFDNNIGTHLIPNESDHHSSMFRIPSTFDFSKSPIYYIHGRKMSKDFIDESLLANAKTINAILKSPKHMNEKGIIHTGSYKNAYTLLDLLDDDVKKRIHIYKTSKEKQDILLDYMESTNGVLIGPTLTEGIDLPEDGCRFIIILKIPYPYLGDNLVKAKSVLFPRWYNSETSKNVIQGIGRGNRTPTDWSTTYILDGCFSSLYQKTKNQYPDEIQKRIQVISNRQN